MGEYLNTTENTSETDNDNINKPLEFRFTHGREVLAWFLGAGLGVILGAITYFALSIIGYPFDREVMFTAPLVVGVAGLLTMYYLIPTKHTNIACLGVLHQEYVEVSIGNKSKTLYYKDIKSIGRRQSLKTKVVYWNIESVHIREPIGMGLGLRKKNRDQIAEIDAFVGAVEARCKTEMWQSKITY